MATQVDTNTATDTNTNTNTTTSSSSSTNTAERDYHLNSLFRRIREIERGLKEEDRPREESKYQSKVYNRNLDIKMEYINSILIRNAIELYKKIKPYLYQSMTMSELYEHLDGKRLFDEFDIKAEKTLLFRLPTFHLQGIGQKIHYFYVIYRDCITANQCNALSRLMRSHAQYDARKHKYRVDAVTVAVIANRADEADTGKEKETEKEKQFIIGNCRSAIVLVGFNNADLLNRLCSIMSSFYASKLAGIFAGDQIKYQSKQGLKVYFLKHSFSLLSNLIKSGTLELPHAGPHSTLSLDRPVEDIVIKLLYILEMFKNAFKTTASVIRDTYDQLLARVFKRLEKKVKGKMKVINDVERYITRKPMRGLPLRQLSLADLLYEAIYDMCVFQPFRSPQKK